MEYELSNGKVKAVFKSLGAELKSLVDLETNREMMWEADPAFWPKTAPILFPFIGKLVDASYLYQGEKFGIQKHGIAREMEFSLVEEKADEMTFAISHTPETLVKFPFPFTLSVTYKLEEKTLSQIWKVTNTGTETMYFSLGGHPAFACPVRTPENEGKKRTVNFVKLLDKDGKILDVSSIPSTDIGVPDGLLTGNKTEIPVSNGLISIVDGIFDQDALCFEEQGVAAIGLVDDTGKEYVRVTSDAPVWGVWSMPTSDCGYVCLEPWWGICDGVEGPVEIAERPYTNSAAPGETFEAKFNIQIF